MTAPRAPAEEQALAERYLRFMEQPVVRRFTDGGGRVHLATERQPPERISLLAGMGHRHFAEKFVQEMAAKWQVLPRDGVTLHLYGRLQTNKAAAALRLADLVESLDRQPLAAALARYLGAGSRARGAYLQVNTGLEPQKGGVAPEAAAGLLARCRETLPLPVVGVMAIPPRNQDPVPHFRWLRAFADAHGLEHCMMGMSDDHAAAIRCGATAIRIGRAVFACPPHG
ncbi:MAG TPA: alanine racemase [Azospirillaceae bacterium]|nr:alanine racemase [Azospirillaceae bacterium]